jgi:hypothetical protein
LQPTVIEKAAGVMPALFTDCQFFGIDHFSLTRVFPTASLWRVERILALAETQYMRLRGLRLRCHDLSR